MCMDVCGCVGCAGMKVEKGVRKRYCNVSKFSSMFSALIELIGSFIMKIILNYYFFLNFKNEILS